MPFFFKELLENPEYLEKKKLNYDKWEPCVRVHQSEINT